MLTVIISLNSVKKLMDVMVKYGVHFELRTEFLNIISTSFVFKGLRLFLWLTKTVKEEGG
jgi:hypothetical protein